MVIQIVPRCFGMTTSKVVVAVLNLGELFVSEPSILTMTKAPVVWDVSAHCLV